MRGRTRHATAAATRHSPTTTSAAATCHSPTTTSAAATTTKSSSCEHMFCGTQHNDHERHSAQFDV
jgi:hypothetical protein